MVWAGLGRGGRGWRLVRRCRGGTGAWRRGRTSRWRCEGWGRSKSFGSLENGRLGLNPQSRFMFAYPFCVYVRDYLVLKYFFFFCLLTRISIFRFRSLYMILYISFRQRNASINASLLSALCSRSFLWFSFQPSSYSHSYISQWKLSSLFFRENREALSMFSNTPIQSNQPTNILPPHLTQYSILSPVQSMSHKVVPSLPLPLFSRSRSTPTCSFGSVPQFLPN